MKKLFIFTVTACAFAAPFLTNPSQAGLGSATSKTRASSYDAWCGEKGNKCKISFNDGKITVNNSDSIRFNQITYITRNSSYSAWSGATTYTFGIEYKEGESSPEFAEILFGHSDTAKKFWRDLQRACRKCKDINATQVDVNVND